MSTKTGNKRVGVWVMRTAGAGLIGLGVVLGGCNNQLKDENAALQQENAQLRESRAQLEAQNQTLTQQAAASQQGGRDQGWNDGNTGGGRAPRGTPTEQVIELAGDVLFDPGQATLKSSAKSELDRVASTIKSKHSGRTVKIVGHTDTDPLNKTKQKWGTNENLSKARADAVRDYLANKGVSRSSITTVGMGGSQPKGTKKESRRVEVVIVDTGN